MNLEKLNNKKDGVLQCVIYSLMLLTAWKNWIISELNMETLLTWKSIQEQKNRWGQCKRVPGGYTINVNAALLDENICPDDLGLENTILHELLHSCNGCFNHGDKWKILAQRVYDEYGINIKRTSTSSEKGLLNYEREIKPVNHQLTCLKCGHVFKRTKASALVKHPERYRCGCGGKIRLDY